MQPMYEPGKQVSLSGEINCAYGFGQLTSPVRFAKCLLKVGDRNISFEGPDAMILAGRLKKAFPSKAPFEQEAYRTLKLNFKFTSDGTPNGEKAFASLKPERDVVLSCKSDGSPRWAVSIKFNDDVNSATVASFQKEGSAPSIPSELASQPDLKINKQQVEELALLKIEANWPQASLTLQQKKEQTTFETYSQYSGKLRIGSEERAIVCSMDKND